MNRRVILAVAVVATALLVWGGFAVRRAWNNLVTLNVRNADVREVVRKIEWQTWERILVQKDLSGKITLNVKNVPLDEVLNIITEQTSSRWTTFYPLYSSSTSLRNFKQALRGELEPEQHGWTNLISRGFSMRGSPFGDLMRGQNNLVTMNCWDKDLEIATLSLARYARARIVPEDGTAGKVRLLVQQVPMSKAVASLAKQVHRNWDCLYALQSERWGRRGDFADDRGPRDDREGRGDRDRRETARADSLVVTNSAGTNTPATDTNLVALQQTREQRREAMQQRYQDVISTFSPEERKQLEERRQLFEGMAQLSPEERRQRFEEFRTRPEFQRGMQNRGAGRVLNTTPDQRVAHDRRHLEERRRREQRQQQNPSR